MFGFEAESGLVPTGDNGFLGKMMTVFMDCEKIVTDQFENGIASLKALVEGQN